MSELLSDRCFHEYDKPFEINSTKKKKIGIKMQKLLASLYTENCIFVEFFLKLSLNTLDILSSNYDDRCN
jgi:hypothetical protein